MGREKKNCAGVAPSPPPPPPPLSDFLMAGMALWHVAPPPLAEVLNLVRVTKEGGHVVDAPPPHNVNLCKKIFWEGKKIV